MHPSLRFFATAALLLSGACHSSTEPAFAPSEAAGTYVLETVVGRGPISGSFVLASDGSAVRTARYALSPTVTAEFEAIGTFQLLPGAIAFSLRENSGQAESLWPVRGDRSGIRFNIQYPDPADGPNIVETYRRQ